MATATAKKQATTTKNRAKATTTSARTTTQKAQATAASAERTVQTVVRDGAYAYVGLADTAVGFARTLPGKVDERLRVELPKVVNRLTEETPKVVEDRIATLRANAEQEFDTLASRGRVIVETLQRNAKTRDAREQARVARNQLKAAAENVRKALFAGQAAVNEAADTAADAVKASGQAAERQQYEAMSVDELRDLAGRRNIAGRSELSKSQLVDALVKA